MKKNKERPGGLAGLAILNLFRKPATQTAQLTEGNARRFLARAWPALAQKDNP